jgi:hypothetical protein
MFEKIYDHFENRLKNTLKLDLDIKRAIKNNNANPAKIGCRLNFAEDFHAGGCCFIALVMFLKLSPLM